MIDCRRANLSGRLSNERLTDDFTLFLSLNTVEWSGAHAGGREREWEGDAMMSIGKLEDDCGGGVEEEGEGEEEGDGGDEGRWRGREWKWLHSE